MIVYIVYFVNLCQLSVHTGSCNANAMLGLFIYVYECAYQ
jgi:hypothetical protein